MAKILHKRAGTSGKVPLTTDLSLGEIAVNTYDGKVFTKKNNGTDAIVEVGAQTLTGDITGSGNGSINTTLSNSGVAPGVYSKVTVDAKGRVTAGTDVSSDDVKTHLGYTPEDVSKKNVVNGYAGLGADGKLPSSLLPALAITDTYVVASQAEMLAVAAQTGDIAVRTDLSRSYILKGSSPSTLADWQELLGPVGSSNVSSVNSMVGDVSLTTSNIPEGTGLYHTDARVRSVPLTGLSTATSTAVTAADSVLVSAGKLQAQVTNRALKGANSDITSLSGLTTALSISQGGTGAKTAVDARNNLAVLAKEHTSAYTFNEANGLTTIPSSSGADAVGGWVRGHSFKGTQTANSSRAVFGAYGGGTSVGYAYINVGSNDATLDYDSENSLRVTPTQPQWGSNKIWHAGNDGAGSGLDADLLDGANAEVTPVAYSIVKRDLSGYIEAVHYKMTVAPGTARNTDTVFYSSNNDYFYKNTADGFKTSLALNNVENKSSATIRGELTQSNVLTALSYTPPVQGNFVTGTNNSIQAADYRLVSNPNTMVGYAKGVRFRFGATNDIDTSQGFADVIDLSTYADASGGGVNSLYFRKDLQQVIHKFAGAGATAWTTKTLAYTDSNITGNAATATNASNLGSVPPSKTMQKKVYCYNNGGPSLDGIVEAQYGFAYGGQGNNSGAFIHFGGLGQAADYPCQISANYGPDMSLKFRTKNDDDVAGGFPWNPWREIWHSGNLVVSQSPVGSSVVKRTGEGYVFGNYLNMTDDGNPGAGAAAVTAIITKQGDDYYRSTDKARVKSFLAMRGNEVSATRSDHTSFIEAAHELSWRYYGNGHTVYDASSGYAPGGAAKNNVNPDIAWSASYPTLMGYNGNNTYGVRVDSARLADAAVSAGKVTILTDHTYAGEQYLTMNRGGLGSGPENGATQYNSAYLYYKPATGRLTSSIFEAGTGVETRSFTSHLGDNFSWNGITVHHYGMKITPYNGGQWTILSGYSGLAFCTAGVERLYIDSDGLAVFKRDIIIDGGDSAFILQSRNAAASYANQFYIKHNLSAVEIGNSRGALNVKGVADSANKLNGSAYTDGANGWFRSVGAAGWYSETYGVGIYATGAGVVRTYNNAEFVAAKFWGDGGGLSGTASSLTSGNTQSVSGATGGSYTWTADNLFQGNRASSASYCTLYTGGYGLQAFSTDGGAAAMTFHRSGSYAINFGLDPDHYIRIGGYSAAANLLQLDTAGNLTMKGNITAYSDERLKTNWKDLSSTFVQEWANVKSGSFDRIDIKETQIGLGAQSVQKVLPLAVQEMPDGHLTVNYGAASAVATVALAKEILELKAELRQQAALIKLLMEKVDINV